MVNRRADVQTVLAKCYVAVAEMDHDLREWKRSLLQHRADVAYLVHCWEWERGTR